MREERCSITEFRLAAALNLPEGEPWGLAVVSHGFEAWKDSPKWRLTSETFAAAGLACLRFDHLGCGESPGAFEDITLSGRADQLAAAVEWGRDRLPGPPTFLVGSSFGGATCLCAAARIRPAGMVLLATPADFSFFDLMRTKAEEDTNGLIRMGDVAVKPALFDDLARHDLAGLAEQQRRCLFVHGAEDKLVPAAHAERLHAVAREPKSMFLIPGADHSLSRAEDQVLFVDAAIDWFRGFV